MSSATHSKQNSRGSLEVSNSRPRTIVGTLLTVLAFALLALALLPLVLVITYVIIKGASRFNLSLFTELPPAAFQEGGGIANAIVGTLILVGIAAAISIPIGVLAAVYLSEFAPKRVARWIRFATNVLSGVPSIIVGIFVYGAISTENWRVLGFCWWFCSGGTDVTDYRAYHR